MKINEFDDIIKYITNNWQHIKKEELLDLIDISYNFGYNECDLNKNNFNDDEERYEEGHKEGYEEGYEDGYEEGRNE